MISNKSADLSILHFLLWKGESLVWPLGGLVGLPHVNCLAQCLAYTRAKWRINIHNPYCYCPSTANKFAVRFRSFVILFFCAEWSDQLTIYYSFFVVVVVFLSKKYKEMAAMKAHAWLIQNDSKCHSQECNTGLLTSSPVFFLLAPRGKHIAWFIVQEISSSTL